MARKKQEIALQAEINTQEEWDELIKKEGLLVVDVYQDWCGPCKAVINFFRRVKNEIGDDFLNFAVAKADTIDSLEKYRGRCEPCFLIYGGRSLVGVIRGANPPVLETTIKLKLEEEHKVMKGEMERNETKDSFLADFETDEKVQEVDKDLEEIEREVTLALIKPDIVKAGKVDEIIAKLQENGIEILAQQDRNLTIEEAKEFYHHMADSEIFEDLIKFIASGPSKILVLAKGDAGIIHEFRELIGPKFLDEAKENSPQSIRAIYGTNSIENAIHGADDRDTAQRELAFFFPDFMVPKIARVKHEASNVQRTLALVRPAAYTEYRESILEKINNAGFKVAMQKEVQLTKEEAALFYNQHKDKPFFEELINEMSKGTLLALALEKQNAVQGWRGMLGPKDVEKAKEIDPNSLRAQFSKEDIKVNLIHGSDSDETAETELKYFFPVEQTIAAIKPDGIENEEEIFNKILDAKFKIVKTKRITMEKSFAEEFYSDQSHQEYFNDLIAHMESGPTYFMVLSREDAIRGWRSLIGPKDPKTAEDTYPDSIRAIYGRDINKNAVYGSDNESEVQRVMNLIFGKLEFNEDGSLLPEYEDKLEVVEESNEESINIEETQQETEVTDEKQRESPKAEVSETLEDEDLKNKSQITQENEETDVGEKENSEEPDSTHLETTENVEDSQETSHKTDENKSSNEKSEKSEDKPDSTQDETKNNESHEELVKEQTNYETKEEITVADDSVVSELETKGSNERSRDEIDTNEKSRDEIDTDEKSRDEIDTNERSKTQNDSKEQEESDVTAKNESTNRDEKDLDESAVENSEIENATSNVIQETENPDKTESENVDVDIDQTNNDNLNADETENTKDQTEVDDEEYSENNESEIIGDDDVENLESVKDDDESSEKNDKSVKDQDNENQIDNDNMVQIDEEEEKLTSLEDDNAVPLDNDGIESDNLLSDTSLNDERVDLTEDREDENQ